MTIRLLFSKKKNCFYFPIAAFLSKNNIYCKKVLGNFLDEWWISGFKNLWFENIQFFKTVTQYAFFASFRFTGWCQQEAFQSRTFVTWYELPITSSLLMIKYTLKIKDDECHFLTKTQTNENFNFKF